MPPLPPSSEGAHPLPSTRHSLPGSSLPPFAAASRRLRDALVGETKRQTTVGLHGHGSPIPRVLPDQDAPVGSAHG